MMLLTFVRKSRTARYIKTYLTPKAKLGFPDAKALGGITSRWLLDVDTIYLHIRSLRYSAFMKTPYWMVLSAEIRNRARKRCYLCRRKTDRLQVHHINYMFHGMEHLRWKDRKFLIPICPECHRMQGARREREA
jgi:hypothetical protein